MGKRITIGLGAALLLLATGCGERKAGQNGSLTVATEDVGAALDRLSSEENARSRVTMVDAATGDAAAMPAEWTGPTAYDLRNTEAEPEPTPTPEEQGSAEGKPPAPAPRLALEPVVEESFPSVAE